MTIVLWGIANTFSYAAIRGWYPNMTVHFKELVFNGALARGKNEREQVAGKSVSR